MEAAGLRVERGHRARAVDADQPVGFGAAHRSVGKRPHRGVGAERAEAVADRGGGHRLQPQPLHGLRRLRVLDDVAEDELALAAGVAGIDERVHVLAFEEALEDFKAAFAALDGFEREAGREVRQMVEGPFAAFDVVFLGDGQFEQMADG